MRAYELENGRVYGMPEEHCVFCTHCTDLLYDSSGPYCLLCELGKNYNDGCDSFEDDGYVFDEEAWMERTRKEIEEYRQFKKLIEDNPEIKKICEEERRNIINKIMYGDDSRKIHLPL